MQENKAYAADPTQLSESGQDDPSSTFRLSSKLRSKLEKLAQWRIDPSLIEFSEDAREFRGGFATVSQGLLAPPSPAKGGANESEHITDEHPNSEDGNPQSRGDTQKPEEDHQDKAEGAYSRAAGDEHDVDHTKGEERKENDEEQKSDNQSSIPEIGYGLGPSDHTGGEEPDPGNRDTQSQSDIQKPEKDQQGKNEETDSRIADGDHSQTNDAARQDPENTKDENGDEGPDGRTADPENTKDEQNRDRQASEPKIVAVKRLKIEEDTDLERVLGLALRESEFLVELSHPNIVKFEGFVEEFSEHQVWLIFPWEEHGNLRDFLASGEWEIPERISLINDVTLGLEYLHSREQPIYHGDLKSLNILVNSEFRALITDFGSARHLGDEAPRLRKQMKGDGDQPQSAADTIVGEHITLQALFSATASTITLTGNSYTLRWAAPELLQEERPCLRSDVWSLGWIAYEVMTNTIPFHDVKKDAIVINRVIQGHLPSVTEHARMSLIRALCSLMVQCWSLDPDKRPTAEECRKAISWMPMIVPAPTQGIDEKGSHLRHAHLLNQLGHMYRGQSDLLSAESCHTEALALFTTNSDRMGRAEALRCLADVYRSRKEQTEAVKLYSESLQIFTDLGDEGQRAEVLFGLADVYWLRHDYSEATNLYHESIQIYTSIGDKYGRAISLSGLAAVHRVQREYSEAINLYSEALRIFADAGELKGMANTLWGLAEVHRELKEYGEASRLYSEAVQICTDIGDKQARALNLWGLAEIHRVQHEYDQAIMLYLEAIQIHTEVGDHLERALVLWGLAEVHRAQHKYDEATKFYLEAMQIYTSLGDHQGNAPVLWGLAQVYRVRHEYDEATKLYSEAAQIFTDMGDNHWRARVLLDLAQTHQLQDHHNEAISSYTKASEVLVEIGEFSRASDASENAANIRKGQRGLRRVATEQSKSRTKLY